MHFFMSLFAISPISTSSKIIDGLGTAAYVVAAAMVITGIVLMVLSGGFFSMPGMLIAGLGLIPAFVGTYILSVAFLRSEESEIVAIQENGQKKHAERMVSGRNFSNVCEYPVDKDAFSDGELDGYVRTYTDRIQGRTREDSGNVCTWIRYNGSPQIFYLNERPRIVFTVVKNSAGDGSGRIGRFKNMKRIRDVLGKNKLDLLVLPSVAFPKAGEETLIIEKWPCNVKTLLNESRQEEFYRKYSEPDGVASLNETVRQLVTLIIQSGFSEVSWQTIPLIDIDAQHSFQGTGRRVAICVSELGGIMGGAKEGILGGSGTHYRGLIKCLDSQTHWDIVTRKALKERICTQDELTACIERRKQEIRMDKNLQRFHQGKGITEASPLVPLSGNVPPSLQQNKKCDFLGGQPDQGRGSDYSRPSDRDEEEKRRLAFALNPSSSSTETQGHRATIQTAAQAMIDRINARLEAGARRDCSIKTRRNIRLLNSLWTSIYEENGWLCEILDALVKDGYIFSYSQDGAVYYVQA
jgi:hypothetical protein